MDVACLCSEDAVLVAVSVEDQTVNKKMIPINYQTTQRNQQLYQFREFKGETMTVSHS